MFKHILLPTDGSATSTSAIKNCIAFAKESGAKVTGLHVIPEFQVFTYQTEMLADTREQFTRDSIVQAKKYLAEIETAANAAGVQCDTLYVTSDHPHEAIIKTAQDQGCDLIVSFRQTCMNFLSRLAIVAPISITNGADDEGKDEIGGRCGAWREP